MCKKQKIEIELEQELKIQIDIISKAFNITPEEFLKKILNKEIDFIKSFVGSNDGQENLECYYKHEINMKELRKLEEFEEKNLSIEIQKDLYEDLDKLCKIGKLDINNKIIQILKYAVFSAEIYEENGITHLTNF